MEVHLDSLLLSDRDSSDDDDEDHFIPHRTVDEILLNHSSSSSSPSPPSSPSTSYRYYPQPLKRSDDISLLPAPTLIFDSSGEALRSSPTVALRRHESTPNSGSRSVLPPFFGGVGRANAKPGAALAAAAAASRSVPTPHAAAIKFRRASSGSLPRVLGSQELLPSVATPTSDLHAISDRGANGFEARLGVSSETGFLVGRDSAEDDNLDNFQREVLQTTERIGNGGEFSGIHKIEESLPVDGEALSVSTADGISEVVNSEDVSSSSSSSFAETNVEPPVKSFESQLDFDRYSPILVSDESNRNHGDDARPVDFSATVRSDESELLSASPVSNSGENIDQDMTLNGETHDGHIAILQSKDQDESVDGVECTRGSDAADFVEDFVLKWEVNKDHKSVPKKCGVPLNPLELAEELERKYAFTGMHWEEGAAAQPMRLEGVRRGSTVLGFFEVDANNTVSRTLSSQTFRRDHGSALVLSVHINYIAVGLSKGLIIVVPSKYSPHHVDTMDSKMSMLGLGDRSPFPVTSLCFNQQGDLLFAGYGDGHYTVWDVQKSSVLKVITEHKAAVVHMLYMGQDSQVTRQFNVISGDSKGVVKLIRFSVVPWVNRISYSKSMKLLDESTSRVVCACPLLIGEIQGGAQNPPQWSGGGVSSGAISSMMGGVVGGDAAWKLFDGSSAAEEGVVIFITHQSALVAKVSPTVEVYAQLPKPDGVRDGSMPYAAWKWTTESHGSSSKSVPLERLRVSLLAIAWDRTVQVAKLVKSELKVFGKWTLDSSAVGVAWLDDQMLLVLTSSGQLSLFAKDGSMIHQTSFAVDGSKGDDLISYHTYFTNTLGNHEKAHHNCIAIRGGSVYILGPEQLVVSRLLPWKERIEVLQRAGDWMGALNMAMTLYDGQGHGIIDLPRTLDEVHETVMPYLVQLLLSYVEEVFSYISIVCSKQSGKSELPKDSRSTHVDPDVKEQYARVGGVAIEFCAHIKRTDILFDEILGKFSSVECKEIFLELLEPYILKDMLGSLPPEIMQALVEHYSQKGWLQRIEQCVLHMDIMSLDFNQVVRLCREHKLHGALIYLFNKGLDDFKAPLEELLFALCSSKWENAAPIGYKMLVYLKYCFQGLAFPPGHGTLSSARLPSLRRELVQFLLEDSCVQNSWAATRLTPSKAYRNLHHLLLMDTAATLDVLRYAFVEEEIQGFNQPSSDSANSDVESTEINNMLVGSDSLIQKVVDVLASVLDMSYFQTGTSIHRDDDRSMDMWPSKTDLGYIIEFIAYYLACQRANVSKEILSQILDYLTSEVNLSSDASSQTIGISNRREKQLVALLDALPEGDWDAPYLLHLCERAQFHQVCGLIHVIRNQYLAALDSYMKAVDEPFHAFAFIHVMLRRLKDQEYDAFRSRVISQISDLVKLNREGSFFLVMEHLGGQSQYIMSELRSKPESLFGYLKTLIEVQSTGNLDFSSLRKGGVLDSFGGRNLRHLTERVEAYNEVLSNFSKILQNYPVHVTDEMTELYLELLCQYERKSVRKFLETLESYRVEHCLRLCQEYGIIDAAAFLLERVGDVGSALLLILSGLDNKFILLDAAIEREFSDADLQHFECVVKKEEVSDIFDILHACIELCQRNSTRLDPEESECLWFTLLDLFSEPLIDSYHVKKGSKEEADMGMLDEASGKQGNEEACKITWKLSMSHRGAHVLRKLLSLFIKEIVEGMVGFVRLPNIMLKLLSDNGSLEFGDFKLTILGLLGTYDFERRILDTAKALIDDDTYYTMSLLKKGASHGYAPRSLQCCVCNGPLTKVPSGSRIRVYSCGHWMHLNCELQEEASLGWSSALCPICIHRSSSQISRGKSVLVENGLVSKSSSRSHHMHGTISLLPHDNDTYENSCGSHLISRFELLNNLQKDQRSIHIENMPQLRLAPPAIYHEKVKKGIDLLAEGASRSPSVEKPSRRRQIKDVKVKRSSIKFPLKSNLFGKEKMGRR